MAVGKHVPGCCCGFTPCGTPTSRTVVVRACPGAVAPGGSTTATGLPVAGVTVNFTAAGDSRSGTTDASGNVTFSGLGALTYTRQAVAPDSRYVTVSASAAVTCGTTATLPITFNIAAGFTCGNPSAGSPCSPRPVATTLYLTDPVLGPVTLVFNSGSATWEGSLLVSLANVREAGCVNPATRDVRVSFSLSSVGPIVGGKNSQWRLVVSTPYCSSGGVNYLWVADAFGSSGNDVAQGDTTAGGCPETGAVSIGVSFATNLPNVLQSIYGSGSQTFTFSE